MIKVPPLARHPYHRYPRITKSLKTKRSQINKEIKKHREIIEILLPLVLSPLIEKMSNAYPSLFELPTKSPLARYRCQDSQILDHKHLKVLHYHQELSLDREEDHIPLWRLSSKFCKRFSSSLRRGR